MYITPLIIALCIIIVQFAQGAASDMQIIAKPTTSQAPETPDIMDAMLGFSHSKRGACIMLKSLLQDDEPSCSITIVYSEHPILQENNAAKLKSIAVKINHSKEKYNCTDLYKLCTAKVTKYAAYSPVESRSDGFMHGAIRPMYNLIALCIKLESQCLIRSGCIQEPKSLQAGISNLREKNTDGHVHTTAHALCHTLNFINESIISPAEFAAQQQITMPDNPFNLIIDLEAWRKIVEPYHLAAQKKAEQIAAAKEHTNKDCRLQ